MKPLREVARAYMALSEAERQLGEGSYAEAAASCRSAMESARTIPAEEAFDHEGFDAYCFARLSEALVSQDEFSGGLDAADKALRYFNRRGELNQDEGKLWIAAVFSRAFALEGLGNTDAALAEFRKGGEMVAERKGETPRREWYLAEVSKRTSRPESAEKKGKEGYRAWWEFWS